MRSTVLIVNENVNSRIIAETLLASRGIRVRTAQDAMEALDILERQGTDVGLLLIDLDEMAPGSGWELMRQVRRRFGGLPLLPTLRVVVQSERTDPEAERFVRHLGADAFLGKPTRPSELLDVVAGQLNQPFGAAAANLQAGHAV